MNSFQFKAYVTITVPIDCDLEDQEQEAVVDKAQSDFQDAIYDLAETNGWAIEDVEIK